MRSIDFRMLTSKHSDRVKHSEITFQLDTMQFFDEFYENIDNN